MTSNNLLHWRDNSGGRMGPNLNMMIGDKYVGHLYIDASDGINVDELLAEIAAVYNRPQLHISVQGALDNARENGDFNAPNGALNNLHPQARTIDLLDHDEEIYRFSNATHPEDTEGALLPHVKFWLARNPDVRIEGGP